MSRPPKRQLTPQRNVVPAEWKQPAKATAIPEHHEPDALGMPMDEAEFEAELAVSHETAIPLVEALPINPGLVTVRMLKTAWDCNGEHKAGATVDTLDSEILIARGLAERVK